MAQVEVESDIFEDSKARVTSKIRGLLAEYYSADKEDFLNDLADLLDLEKLPKADVEIVLHFGRQTISIPGFEIEADDDEDTEDDE